MQAAVEPSSRALAAGVLIVIGYGLSERMLPGVLEFSRSVSAQGRLEQPLTYWNAIGELAAIGLVLCARSPAMVRARWLRCAAAAASAPLALGLYLAFSRGALFACAAGLVTLVVAAPQRAQLQSIMLTLLAGGAACVVAAPLGGVTGLAAALATREWQGALMLSGAARDRGRRGVHPAPPDGPRVTAIHGLPPRRRSWIALAAICAGFALAVAVGSKGAMGAAVVWREPLRESAEQPLRLLAGGVARLRRRTDRGVGAGGWAVYWLRYRTVDEGAVDAHSLPLQTAAELGLVGLALLLAFLGGVGFAARAAHRFAPAAAAGPIAGFVVYVAHAPLDWDWQMPAVTAVALLLAGALLALGEAAGSAREMASVGAAAGREDAVSGGPAFSAAG